MITISQILKEKGNKVWTVVPSASIQEALQLMSEKGIGAVLVVDSTKVVGIFSERDFARHAVSKEGCTLDSPVSSMMTEEVYFIGPDHTTDECLALMTQKRFRHLPVMDGTKLVGLISIGDIIKWMLSEKDITIRSLENYILGREYSG
jgi:CBS domain-containing protein